jgi:hypothetical protein
MKIVSQIREFFWPLLEGDPSPVPKNVDEMDLTASDDQLKTIYDLALKNFESEEKRNTSIETKSALFIGTLTVIVTVIMAVTTVLIKSDELDIYSLILLSILVLLGVYLCRTIWFSVRALERRTFHSLSYKDLLLSTDENSMYRSIIIKLINNTRKNSISINEKVDNMVMAQEYFKRCIYCVALYSSCLLLKCYNIASDKYYFSVEAFIHEFNAPIWLTTVSVCLNALLISLLLSKAFKKK